MHGTDNAQFRQSGVGKLFVDERLRDYTDDASSVVQARVRDRPHEAYITAAIHKLDAAPTKQPSERLRSLLIHSLSSRTGPAKHANSSKHFASLLSAAKPKRSLTPTAAEVCITH
jgi:hypothetical protein